jgi:hypothetical protein
LFSILWRDKITLFFSRSRQKSLSVLLMASVFLFGCGGSSGNNTGTDESNTTLSGVGNLSTGDAYPISESGSTSYYVIVSDDVILGARLMGIKSIPDIYKIARDTAVCESFTEMGRGVYSLNNCSSKPSKVIAIGGFIDLNGDSEFDTNEAVQSSPLIVDTTVLDDVNFTITPMSTLAAADYTINRTTLATKLGFSSRAAAYQATAANQAMNRIVNAVLSAANSSGFDVTVFSADLVHRILVADGTGVDNLRAAISNLVNATESQTAYGEAKIQSFWNDSRVQAVMNGADAMSAMLAKKVPNGKLRISGLVTTTPTGTNIVKGAALSAYVGGNKIANGVSDKYGKYNIEVDQSAILKNSILSLSAQTATLNLTSSVPTNVLLDKRVNGNINSSHIGSLAISNLTTLVDNYTKTPVSAPCNESQYYRIQTKECLPLENPTWGFQGFTVPADNIYPLLECTQKALQGLLNTIPAEGGKIVMPACTINTTDGISIPDNVILEGSGMGKTILNNTVTSTSAPTSAVNLLGENIIVRNFTVNGNSTTLNGISSFYAKGNILVEFIEAMNFKSDQGAGISFLRDNALENSRMTARYNKTSNGLHGIDTKVRTLAKMLVYSNEAFGNSNYGLDLSTNDSIEVAGNYLHNNAVAGAKSPIATNIIYHHNDINFNTQAGLVYMESNPSGIIIVKNNNISNNTGPAFASWSGTFYQLVLTNNNVSGSTDANGYNILGTGITKIDVTGDHGNIWTNGVKSVIYY